MVAYPVRGRGSTGRFFCVLTEKDLDESLRDTNRENAAFHDFLVVVCYFSNLSSVSLSSIISTLPFLFFFYLSSPPPLVFIFFYFSSSVSSILSSFYFFVIYIYIYILVFCFHFIVIVVCCQRKRPTRASLSISRLLIRPGLLFSNGLLLLCRYCRPNVAGTPVNTWLML